MWEQQFREKAKHLFEILCGFYRQRGCKRWLAEGLVCFEIFKWNTLSMTAPQFDALLPTNVPLQA